MPIPPRDPRRGLRGATTGKRPSPKAQMRQDAMRRGRRRTQRAHGRRSSAARSDRSVPRTPAEGERDSRRDATRERTNVRLRKRANRSRRTSRRPRLRILGQAGRRREPHTRAAPYRRRPVPAERSFADLFFPAEILLVQVNEPLTREFSVDTQAEIGRILLPAVLEDKRASKYINLLIGGGSEIL